MTRRQMAEALTLTPSALEENLLPDTKLITSWETGETRWPSPMYRRALQDLTGRDAASLGFLPPKADHGTPRSGEPHLPGPGNDQSDDYPLAGAGGGQEC
jgi:hypothetical protein